MTTTSKTARRETPAFTQRPTEETLLLQDFHAVAVLFDGQTGPLDLFGDCIDVEALVLKLAIEPGVGLGDLSEISADALGHGCHCRLGCLLRGGLAGEVLVGHGDEPRDVRKQLKQLGDDLWPHAVFPSLLPPWD